MKRSFSQIASIPIGYNNSALAKVANSDEMIQALINRPALGNFPSKTWKNIISSGLLKAAPKGLGNVFTACTGSDANETAFKAAFIWRRTQERGNVDFTEEECISAMENKSPGAPQYSILSFTGGFHGRTFGSLSATRSKPIHKLDIPAFDWPAAPFPKLRYPLAEFTADNEAEEQRCLHETEQIIETSSSPVAAAIIEPIQAEGGDNHASSAYFRGLRSLLHRKNVLMIVDEVQTGVGATGKMWAHEHWDLEMPPDMVTFSKKAQAAGFYYGDLALRPAQPYRYVNAKVCENSRRTKLSVRQFSTWLGDPARALIFRGILEEISRKDLIRKTSQVGQYLYGQLEGLARAYPQEIQNLRGKDRGTFVAWDSPRRDEILRLAKAQGVNLGGSGVRAIRLRPMLIFEEHHGKRLYIRQVGLTILLTIKLQSIF